MFARFRPSLYRLQVSIVETRRVGGKVRQEHIANRVAFCRRVHERLAKLSNRIDPATQGKIRGDVDTQIPMAPTMPQLPVLHAAPRTARRHRAPFYVGSVVTRSTRLRYDPARRGERSDQIVIDHAIFERRVNGQDDAIKKVRSVVIRAYTGLSGLQHSKKQKMPKGVLFFVGPTGVGKTELAKSLAEFLCGDEDACIRFDMSEFNHEHSDQRLIGAPPGYVGYQEGGQLTNAVVRRPDAVW